MKYLSTIILMLSLNTVEACECVEFEYSGKHVRQFFNWYDKVFIGNLLETEGDNYKFEVIEGFKNCAFRDTLWGKYNNSCSIVPSEKGLWIVYASIQDSTTSEIDIDACNSSRNLKSNRQYLYDGYDTNTASYKLKEEQSFKLIELSILEKLNTQQSISEVESKSETLILHKIEELKQQQQNNWISLIAIALSLIALFLNIQTRRKASR